MGRPDCVRCGMKATTTMRIHLDLPAAHAPMCDVCCFAINDGAELPGGAR